MSRVAIFHIVSIIKKISAERVIQYKTGNYQYVRSQEKLTQPPYLLRNGDSNMGPREVVPSS